AARRSQCTNNMKQMTLGMMYYEQTHKRFAPGNVVGRAVGRSGQPTSAFAQNFSDPQYGNSLPWGSYGWAAFILPFMEQQSLYKAIDFTLPAYAQNVFEDGGGGSRTQRGPGGDVRNKAASESMPPSFACPSVPQLFGPGIQKDYGINHGTGACCP